MRTLTDIDIQRAAVLKAYRTAIRTKYSIMADEEIARTLPLLEEEIDKAIQTGGTLELNPADVFDRVEMNG